MASAVSTCMANAEPGNLYPKLNSWGRHYAQKTQFFLALSLTA
jgi:hypothetical protein